jgi:hypothetical protein
MDKPSIPGEHARGEVVPGQIDARQAAFDYRRDMEENVPLRPPCLKHPEWVPGGPGLLRPQDIASACPECARELRASELQAREERPEQEIAIYSGKPASGGKVADALWQRRQEREAAAGKIRPGSTAETELIKQMNEARDVEIAEQGLTRQERQIRHERAIAHKHFGSSRAAARMLCRDRSVMNGPGVKAGD